MKLTGFALSAILFGALFSVTAEEARIDITGMTPGMTFKHFGSPGIKTQEAGWLKAQGKSGFIALKSATEEWSTMKFAFTPSISGRVAIDFKGQWAKELEDRGYVLYARLTVKDGSGSNLDFGEIEPSGKLAKFWKVKEPAVLPAAAAGGENAIRVNHDNFFGTVLQVEANKTCVVTIDVKEPED